MTENTHKTSAPAADEQQVTGPAAETADAQLGDAGKRALQALRQEVKDLRAELKKYQASESAEDAQRDAGDPADSTSESAMPADADARPVATTDADVKPTPPRFVGAVDSGPRLTPASARQLTADDLRSMSPRAIDQARREGRLRDLLSGK